MKTWLTKYERQFLALVIAVGVAFTFGWYAGHNATDRNAYAALWEAIVDLPDPEQCALCSEGVPYHAPCLVNLSTGQMGELTVYTHHPFLQGEIAPMEKQQTGTFRFLPCAGLTAVQDTCYSCQVILPKEKELMNPALFCKACRQLLAGGGLEGYVIVDLYDLNHIRIYPVREGGCEVIRDYRVSVSSKQGTAPVVCVEGIVIK